MWSVAVTLAELYTGKILFPGKSNNQMLKLFMDYRGKVPNKLIRKSTFKDQHFDSNFNFLYQDFDKVTEKEKTIVNTNVVATRDLGQELSGGQKVSTEQSLKVNQLKDWLEKALALDPSKRITPKASLLHPFIQERLA